MGNQVQIQAVIKIGSFGLEVRSSVHLSYRRLIANYTISFSFGRVQFNNWYL